MKGLKKLYSKGGTNVCFLIVNVGPPTYSYTDYNDPNKLRSILVAAKCPVEDVDILCDEDTGYWDWLEKVILEESKYREALQE